jgi:ABC-type multidrug transport system ATPase subunit
LPIGAVLATHVESFLLVRALLKKVHRLEARAELEGSPLPGARPQKLTARNLKFRYGEDVALDLESLDLELDEPCLLMGPNGAGKTTFGALLTGVFFPSAGELAIDGVPCAELDRDLLAFVPQNPLIVETLSIEANVRLVAPSAPREAIGPLLARLGLHKPLDAAAGHLSKGEQRRIAFARALLKAPALLVLDEPDAWLDEGGRRILLEIVREESAKRAVVLISHRAEFIAAGFRVVTLTARHQLGERSSRAQPALAPSEPSSG